MRIQKNLNLADAKAIASAATAKAQTEGWHVVIAIVDAGGHLLYLERDDLAPLGAITVAQDKARTALLFRRPSKALEDRVVNGELQLMTLAGATTIEGGLPLVSEAEIVGAIGVSGVTSQQDGEVAAAGAAAIRNL